MVINHHALYGLFFIIIYACAVYPAISDAINRDENAFNTFQDAAEAYKATPTKQNGAAVLDSYDSRFKLYARENKALIEKYENIKLEAQQQMLDNKDWGLLLSFSDSGRGLKDSLIDKMTKVYEGDSATIYSVIGNRKLELDQPVAAYDFYVKAALLNNDFYDYPRGLAYNYGCTDLYNIWGAYGASKRDLDGSRYPMTPATLSTEELVLARNQLLKRQLPSFAKDCALNYLR
tara:strand:- start:643 stop:1341 length:699 start_codon:yes stop_codon:yes gene_type:complete